MNKKIKVVCIPYAGGSAMMYGKWKDKFGKNIEILPLELPGRGLRFKDKNATDMESLSEDLLKKLDVMVKDEEYILLGFCYGAIVAYSMYQLMYKRKVKNKPKGMILISSLTPGQHSKAERLFEMSNIKIAQMLLGVFSFNPWRASEEEMDILKTMLEIVNPDVAEELRKMKLYQLVLGFVFPSYKKSKYCQDVLRIMKEDGKIMYNYNGAENSVPVSVPVIAIHGKIDNVVSYKDMEKWREICNDEVQLMEVEGGHLMLFDEDTDVIEALQEGIDYITKTKYEGIKLA